MNCTYEGKNWVIGVSVALGTMISISLLIGFGCKKEVDQEIAEMEYKREMEQNQLDNFHYGLELNRIRIEGNEEQRVIEKREKERDRETEKERQRQKQLERELNEKEKRSQNVASMFERVLNTYKVNKNVGLVVDCKNKDDSKTKEGDIKLHENVDEINRNSANNYNNDSNYKNDKNDNNISKSESLNDYQQGDAPPMPNQVQVNLDNNV